MINISATNAIDQAEKIITDIFENGEHDKNTGEGLYRVMTLLSDAREAINSDTENKSDVKPFKKMYLPLLKIMYLMPSLQFESLKR